MSSRGWKLSSALIVALAFGSSTPANADDLGTAMKCLYIGSLSYADQPDSAATIAKAALRSCRKETTAAVNETLVSQRKRGLSITYKDAERIVIGDMQERLEGFIVEMRGLAKQRGPNFYAEAAERMARGS